MVTADQQPSLEERVARLENEAKEIRSEIAGRLRSLHTTIQREIRTEAEWMRSDLDFHVKDLRRLIGVGVEPNARRTTGLLLFAVGLVLQTASNYLG